MISALQAVEAEIGELFGLLGELGGQFGQLAAARSATADDAGLRRDDLVALRPAIFSALTRRGVLAAGTGVITAPGALADAPLWLEWWWTPPAGTPERLRVNLDPAAPDFYDYTTAPWYTRDAARIVGPYVDHFCTGEYTITLSVPVRARDRFLGVAAADVLVARLERRVLPALLGLGRPVALTSADGRIIASTSARWPPGTLGPADGQITGHGGWRLAELGGLAPVPP